MKRLFLHVYSIVVYFNFIDLSIDASTLNFYSKLIKNKQKGAFIIFIIIT